MKKIAILVVDDEEFVRFVLRETVARMGENVIVETAADGDEALAKIRSHHFDLIITDLKLPGMSGIELTEALRDLQESTPVLWITAYKEPHTTARAQELDVATCLAKPATPLEIRAAAREALDPSPSIA